MSADSNEVRKGAKREAPPSPLLVNDADLARMLGIARPTVWGLYKRGVLPAPVKIGGSTRWSVREVEAVIDRLLAAPPEERLPAEALAHASALGAKGQAAKRRRRMAER